MTRIAGLIEYSTEKLAKPSELLLITGAILFVAGALGYIGGHLSQNQTPVITAMALIFISIGTIMKKLDNNWRLRI